MTRQRRHWARPTVPGEGSAEAEDLYQKFQYSYKVKMSVDDEEYYKDKLESMEVSSELVWLQQQELATKGVKKFSVQAQSGHTKAKKPGPEDNLSSTDSGERVGSETRRLDACTSTSSTPASETESVGVKGNESSVLKEKLKKKLQKLKSRCRLKSATRAHRDRKDVEKIASSLDSEALGNDSDDEGDEYSDSFESFDSEEEYSTRDNLPLAGGSDSDICCYESPAKADDASSLELNEGSLDLAREAQSVFSELPPSPEDLGYDDLIQEYVSGFKTKASEALEQHIILESPKAGDAADDSDSVASKSDSDSDMENSPAKEGGESKLEESVGQHEATRKPLNTLNSFCNRNEPVQDLDPKPKDKVSLEASKDEVSESAQAIPLLPVGSVLKIIIHSNWGDKDYVGLNGVEIFDKNGQIVRFASPNIQLSLENSSLDGKVDGFSPLVRLIDGNNLTCDETHIWSIPFSGDAKPEICFNFLDQTSIGAVRIWNYNKSRIHSHRGAKEVELLLDETCVFHEDIQKAPGIASEAWQGAESILFTTDEQTLQNIEMFDSKYASVLNAPQVEIERFRKSLALPPIEMIEVEEQDVCVTGMDAVDSTTFETVAKVDLLTLEVLVIEILSTWGDEFYVGLSGLEILDENKSSIDISMDNLDAMPLDLNVLEDSCSDDRTLDKLINGTNVTTDDFNMWLAPADWEEEKKNTITLNLGRKTKVYGLKLWNYNKGLEDTHRGIKCVNIYADGELISPPGGYIVPKAPGTCTFDFSYLITLAKPPVLLHENCDSNCDSQSLMWLNALPTGAAKKLRECRAKGSSQLINPGWHVPLLPCGFVLKFELFNTWGDPHYVGLSGIEIVDAISGVVVVPASSISAEPKGVCELEGMEKDVRLPAKLVDGHNKAHEIAHSWLAPFNEASPNVVCVYLNRPIVLAAVRIWNYAKSPLRGAKEFHVYLDDNLIFDGILHKYEQGLGEDFHQTLLFTHDEDVIREEKEYISDPSVSDPTEVLFTNDNQLVKGKSESRAIRFGPRPQTSVVGI